MIHYDIYNCSSIFTFLQISGLLLDKFMIELSEILPKDTTYKSDI